MRLGIVGHAAEKFDERTEKLAKDFISEHLYAHEPEEVVSGRSPMGGVDVWAEQIANIMKIPTKIYPPKVNTWASRGGFRDRNLQIARRSDHVLVVVVEKLPADFKGMKFAFCYHCKGRNPSHVKSGACWTAFEALKLGKEVTWRIIS